METKRIFIGTFAVNDKFESIYPKLQDEMASATTGKWVEPESLHFTYYFLGETEVPKIQEIKEGLDDWLKEFDSTLIFKGLGCFPSPTRPRVLYAGIENPDNLLEEIHTGMGKALEDMGMNPEKRKFNPHLTLQRVKSFQGPEFEKLLTKYKNTKFGQIKSYKTVLIQSKLTRLGPVYTII